MRVDYIKIYKSIHTWTGIISGMALFIAFYAGALTVFKEPIARWASPPSAIQNAQTVPLAQVPALINGTLAAHPQAAKGFSIHLHEMENIPARLTWEVRDPQADDHDTSSSKHFAASLDIEGRAQATAFQPTPVANFIDTLHRVVGLPVDNDPNRWVMGVISALYALALFSGVVVLIPTLVKDFFALRVGKNFKRMWLDAHNVVGIISLPFHIFMAISAVVFAFHDGIYSVQDKLIHDGQWSTAFSRGADKSQKAPPPRDASAMLSPEQLLARTQEIAPDLQVSQLEYQAVTTPRATVRIWGKDDRAISPRARGGFVALDPYSGEMMNTDYLPGKQTTPNLFISSFFALHMASFGGSLVQWLYFLLGLAGAWLFYSGNLLWVETRRKRAARNGPVPQQRRDTRLMASATVGVCIGCISGISLMLAASKWLGVQTAHLGVWLHAVYYSVFFACIASAFLWGAARSVVALLWTACAFTLLIPLTSLIGWMAPATGWWAHASLATLGVDLTATAGALCLAWMARTTERRVRGAAEDSVWSRSPSIRCAPAAELVPPAPLKQ